MPRLPLPRLPLPQRSVTGPVMTTWMLSPPLLAVVFLLASSATPFHSHDRRSPVRVPTLLFLTPVHIATPQQVLAEFSKPNAVILDVRSQSEIELHGLIQTYGRPWVQTGCTAMECPSLAGAARSLFPHRDVPIIVHCSTGCRAAKAKEILDRMGYRHVVNAGGYDDLDYLQQAANKSYDPTCTIRTSTLHTVRNMNAPNEPGSWFLDPLVSIGEDANFEETMEPMVGGNRGAATPIKAKSDWNNVIDVEGEFTKESSSGATSDSQPVQEEPKEEEDDADEGQKMPDPISPPIHSSGATSDSQPVEEAPKEEEDIGDERQRMPDPISPPIQFSAEESLDSQELFAKSSPKDWSTGWDYDIRRDADAVSPTIESLGDVYLDPQPHLSDFQDGWGNPTAHRVIQPLGDVAANQNFMATGHADGIAGDHHRSLHSYQTRDAMPRTILSLEELTTDWDTFVTTRSVTPPDSFSANQDSRATSPERTTDPTATYPVASASTSWSGFDVAAISRDAPRGVYLVPGSLKSGELDGWSIDPSSFTVTANPPNGESPDAFVVDQHSLVVPDPSGFFQPGFGGAWEDGPRGATSADDPAPSNGSAARRMDASDRKMNLPDEWMDMKASIDPTVVPVGVAVNSLDDPDRFFNGRGLLQP